MEVEVLNIHTVVTVIVSVLAVTAACAVKSFGKIAKFVLGTFSAVAVMFAVNTLFPDFSVGINPFTVFTSAVLGLPGTVMVYILKNLIC